MSVHSPLDSLHLEKFVEPDHIEKTTSTKFTSTSPQGDLDGLATIEIPVYPGNNEFLDIGSLLFVWIYKFSLAGGGVNGTDFANANGRVIMSNPLDLLQSIELLYKGRVLQSIQNPGDLYHTNKLLEYSKSRYEHMAGLDNHVLVTDTATTFNARDATVLDWPNFSNKPRTTLLRKTIRNSATGNAELCCSIRLQDLFPLLKSGAMLFNEGLILRCQKRVNYDAEYMNRTVTDDIASGRVIIRNMWVRATSVELKPEAKASAMQLLAKEGGTRIPYVSGQVLISPQTAFTDQIQLGSYENVTHVVIYPRSNLCVQSLNKMPRVCSLAGLNHAYLSVNGATVPAENYRLDQDTFVDTLYTDGYLPVAQGGRYSDESEPVLTIEDFQTANGVLIFNIPSGNQYQRQGGMITFNYSFKEDTFPGANDRINFLIVIYSEKQGAIDQLTRVIRM